MCRKIIITVLALSLCLVTSVGAGTVRWDFENGKDHFFSLWSVVSAVGWTDDPSIAGDESITGVGGHTHLPDAGVAWTVGPPNQFDGQAPAVEEGCHVVGGVLEYGPCNDPFDVFEVTPPSYTNSRGQSSYLNTYNLSQWGDNLHIQQNDQVATSPMVVLGEGAVLTVWSHGGGSGTHAPEYDPDPTMMYTDGSSGIAVLSADKDDEWALLASLHLNGKGTLTEDTLDLSAFAGKKVYIDVVDAFQGAWGWIAIDEIQITNATCKVAGFVVQMTDDVMDWGFDQAQYDHLQALGCHVVVIEQGEIGGGTFTRADANELDVLLISESISSSSADPLRGTSAPVMHQEAYGWDNWNFMGPADNIHWLERQTQVEIVNDTHPIMVDAGFLVGMLPWFTAPDQYTTENISNMAPGAELLVKADANDYAVVFAIEKGAELADGSLAAGRVVGFSIPGNQDGLNAVDGIIDASIMTDEAWALYDAAIRWLSPPPPPMVAHWPMDDGADTIVTDVVGGNNGTMVGLDPAAAWITDGGVRFDNIDGHHIEVPHSDALDFGDVDFTISMMVRYPTPPVDTDRWIIKGTHGDPGTGSRYEVFHTSGTTVRFSIDNGPDNIKSKLEVPDAGFVTGEWVHVVAVRDAANDLIAIYADGVLQGTTTDSSGDISSGEDMWIGESTDETDTAMSGDIDDVIIFDKALTEDEIAAIY